MVYLRKFPYPYRAALTISNDFDGVAFEDFLEMHRFLNTKQNTTMGEGLGLEIGDTFWMYSACPEPIDSFSYFKGMSLELSDYAETMGKLIRAGYLDCLHTYGNFSQKGGFTRELAEQAVAELENKGLKIDVWVNHGDTHNFQNMGHALAFGDAPYTLSSGGIKAGVVEYHSDITIAYGIRFIWKSELTGIVGQDCQYGIRQYVLRQAKFRIKKLLVDGATFNTNDLIRTIELRDGLKVYSFKKFGASDKGTYSDNLPEMISRGNLNILKKKNGYSIVYIHLGIRNTPKPPLLSDKTQESLRLLAKEYRTGEIYVTTTSKLLNYNAAHKFLRWHHSSKGSLSTIVISGVADEVRGDYIPTPEQLQGITFYTPNAKNTNIFIGAVEVANIQRNARDYTGRESVSIPLTHLHYPL